MPCASCQHHALPAKVVAPLLQIRRGYRARWNNLELSVEADDSRWTILVKDLAADKPIYTAHRAGARAAMSIAAEFAIFRQPGAENSLNPDSLARSLDWQQHWAVPNPSSEHQRAM